jgi:hypothetical protein
VRRREDFVVGTEQRFFVLNGKPFGASDDVIPTAVSFAAQRVASPFFSVDVAERRDGIFVGTARHTGFEIAYLIPVFYPPALLALGGVPGSVLCSMRFPVTRATTTAPARVGPSATASQDSLDIREVIFVNERCRVDYEAMAAEVRESADQAIDALQNARPLPPKLYQSLGGTLTGINEIRLGYDDNTYRVYVL